MAPTKYRDGLEPVSKNPSLGHLRMTHAPSSPIAAPVFRLEADGKDRRQTVTRETPLADSATVEVSGLAAFVRITHVDPTSESLAP